MAAAPTFALHPTRYYVILTFVFTAMFFGGVTYIIEELRMQHLRSECDAQMNQNEQKILEVINGVKTGSQ